MATEWASLLRPSMLLMAARSWGEVLAGVGISRRQLAAVLVQELRLALFARSGIEPLTTYEAGSGWQ